MIKFLQKLSIKNINSINELMQAKLKINDKIRISINFLNQLESNNVNTILYINGNFIYYNKLIKLQELNDKRNITHQYLFNIYKNDMQLHKNDIQHLSPMQWKYISDDFLIKNGIYILQIDTILIIGYHSFFTFNEVKNIIKSQYSYSLFIIDDMAQYITRLAKKQYNQYYQIIKIY